MVIAADEDEARAALEEFLVQERFGAGRVVVEEALEGEELSLLALCDGETAVPMAPAQDYKRIFDGDAARTPAAWAPTRRCPASTARGWRRSCAPSTSRWSTSCATAARRSTAASTPG